MILSDLLHIMQDQNIVVREVSLIGRKYYQRQNKNCTERFHEDLPLLEENKRERINLKTDELFVEESLLLKNLDIKTQPRNDVLAK